MLFIIQLNECLHFANEGMSEAAQAIYGAFEGIFICHRRRLHRFTKTPSSPYEGIFIFSSW